MRKIRVIITKVGLDSHDVGAKAFSALLREAGMEVIYLGMYQTPQTIVEAAIEEDADVIGVSCLCGEHMDLCPKIAELLRQNNLTRVLLLVGGIIPNEDIPLLKEMGIDEVFPAGSLIEPIVKYITQNVKARGLSQER